MLGQNPLGGKQGKRSTSKLGVNEERVKSGPKNLGRGRGNAGTENGRARGAIRGNEQINAGRTLDWLREEKWGKILGGPKRRTASGQCEGFGHVRSLYTKSQRAPGVLGRTEVKWQRRVGETSKDNSKVGENKTKSNVNHWGS